MVVNEYRIRYKDELSVHFENTFELTVSSELYSDISNASFTTKQGTPMRLYIQYDDCYQRYSIEQLLGHIDQTLIRYQRMLLKILRLCLHKLY